LTTRGNLKKEEAGRFRLASSFWQFPAFPDRHVDKFFSLQRLILFLKTTSSFSLAVITAFHPGFFVLSRFIGTIDSFIV
jgi:hypothetical protein